MERGDDHCTSLCRRHQRIDANLGSIDCEGSSCFRPSVRCNVMPHTIARNANADDMGATFDGGTPEMRTADE